MKIKEITIEHLGRELHIYKLDEMIVVVNGCASVQGYPISGKFFGMACEIAVRNELGMDVRMLDVLSEILASVAEGDLV